MSRDEFFNQKLKKAYNFKDLTGQRFGKLIVINLAGRRIYNENKKSKGTSLWLCKCDCGKEVIKNSNTLKNKNTTSCGQYDCQPRTGRYKKGHKSSLETIDIYAALRSRYKTDAKNRNYVFELTNQEFNSLLIGPCVYCKSKQENSQKYSTWVNVKFTGIDRLDNTKGYTKENSVSCCKKCNNLKNRVPPYIIEIAYKLLFGDKNG